MEIPSHEELQQMSDAQIAELNFFLTIKKMERLSILMIVGGVIMYGASQIAQKYLTN